MKTSLWRLQCKHRSRTNCRIGYLPQREGAVVRTLIDIQTGFAHANLPEPSRAWKNKWEGARLKKIFSPHCLGTETSSNSTRSSETSEEFSEQFEPLTHNMKGSESSPELRQTLGKTIPGNTLSGPKLLEQNQPFELLGFQFTPVSGHNRSSQNYYRQSCYSWEFISRKLPLPLPSWNSDEFI